MSQSEFIWRLQILLVLGIFFIQQSSSLNIKIKSGKSEIQDQKQNGAEISRKFGQINIHGPPPGQGLSHHIGHSLSHLLDSKPKPKPYHKKPFLHHPVHYHGVQNVDYNAGQPVQFWYQWALALALPIIVVPLISILFIQLIQENQSNKNQMQSLGGLAGPHGQGLGSSPVEQNVQISPVMSPEQSQMYGAPQYQQQQQHQQQQSSVPQQAYGVPINRSDQEKYNKLTKNVMDSITTVKDTLKNKKVNDNKLASILANL